MSDPVTNVEIEDVLSSIRRLVSAEEREEPKRRDEPRTAAQQREAKLVLTPAQRVDEESDDSTEMEIEAPEAQAWDEGRFDGIEDAEIVEARAEETDEDILKDLPHFIRSGIHDRIEEPETGPDKAETAPDEADLGHADDVDDGAADTLAAVRDVWDDLEDDAALVADTAEDGPIAQEEPAPEDLHVADFEDEDEGDTGDIDLKALEARIAGFETAVAEKDEEWEPDGTSDDDYAAGPQSPLPWQDVEEDVTDVDQAEANFSAQDAKADTDLAEDTFEEAPAASTGSDRIAEEEEGSRSPSETGSWYSEDAVLDEDALRDMVSEIVRQELQGALGERITRNVRKLVRREIHRALTSQGID